MVRRRASRRRVAALLLCAALACALAACGGGGTSGASGSFTPATPHTLVVATDELPTPGFWEGTIAHPTGGFELGLARALAARFGLASVHVVDVPFRRIVAGDLGGADLALAQVTPTGARARHLAFSSSYLASPPGVLVRAGTEVPDLATAQGLHWAVERATTLADDLPSQIDPHTHTLVTDTQAAAIGALRDHAVDAVLLDLPTALATAHQSAGRLAVAAQLPSDAVLAAALPHGSGNVEAVDSELRALTADGTIHALAQRWLATDVQETGAASVPLLRTTL